MKTRVLLAFVLAVLIMALAVSCGHHKRHKSEHHITNCTTPCERTDDHDTHDCHEGHDETDEGGDTGEQDGEQDSEQSGHTHGSHGEHDHSDGHGHGGE